MILAVPSVAEKLDDLEQKWFCVVNTAGSHVDTRFDSVYSLIFRSE